MSKQPENKTLVDSTVDQLIEIILVQNMQEGAKLPNEYELATKLGIGRSTLREAIRRLVSRNILQVRQGSGTFVSDKKGVPEDPLGLTFIGNDPNLAIELLDIRLMLEPEISGIVAKKASKIQIQRLKQLCNDVEDLINQNKDYSDADAKFHKYLAECSGNKVLRNLIPIITSSVNVVIATTNDENRHHTIEQHRRIIDAIKRKDVAGAKYNMIVHLNTNRDSISRRNFENR